VAEWAGVSKEAGPRGSFPNAPFEQATIETRALDLTDEMISVRVSAIFACDSHFLREQVMVALVFLAMLAAEERVFASRETPSIRGEDIKV
jgi:hypothetical protein